MDVVIQGIQVKEFHFINVEEIDEREKEIIEKREDGLEILKLYQTKKEDGNTDLKIIAKMQFKFSFDERYYFVSDLYGSFVILRMEKEEFDTNENQEEFLKEAVSAYAAKFDMLVAIFSQEIYSGTRMPERTTLSIEKN